MTEKGWEFQHASWQKQAKVQRQDTGGGRTYTYEDDVVIYSRNNPKAEKEDCRSM